MHAHQECASASSSSVTIARLREASDAQRGEGDGLLATLLATGTGGGTGASGGAGRWRGHGSKRRGLVVLELEKFPSLVIGFRRCSALQPPRSQSPCRAWRCSSRLSRTPTLSFWVAPRGCSTGELPWPRQWASSTHLRTRLWRRRSLMIAVQRVPTPSCSASAFSYQPSCQPSAFSPPAPTAVSPQPPALPRLSLGAV